LPFDPVSTAVGGSAGNFRQLRGDAARRDRDSGSLMSDIRFQVTGKDARDVAGRFGALIEGEIGQRPELQEKGGVITLATPAKLYVGQYRTVQDKLARLIGFAAWEAKAGNTVLVGDATGPGQRLDEMNPTSLIELIRK
jgi:hypothetical protein